MDINVRLGGSGGSGRQSKLSARHTANNAINTTQNANKNIPNLLKTGSNITTQATSFMSGGGSSILSKIPIIASIVGGFKLAEGLIKFGANIYQARSGEDMIASNIKAYAKTGASLGLNLVSGSISNYIFTQPRIERQNYMKDYGRELYFQNGYTQKNTLS